MKIPQILTLILKVHLFFVFVIQYTFSTPYKSRKP